MYNLGKDASEELRVLRNVSLPEVAYRELQNLIMTGEIKAGERINESQISEQLGINRAPIREACRRLQQEGLVKIEKNKGAFLRDIPVEEAADLYDVRASLEGLAAMNAATSWKESDMLALIECFEGMQMASAEQDKKQLYSHAADFHTIIVGMSGNQHLIEIIQSVTRKISVFRFKLSKAPDSTISCEDEEAILKAVQDRDAPRASQLMQEHVLKGKMRMMMNFPTKLERN